jgi:hypothetical protein
VTWQVKRRGGQTDEALNIPLPFTPLHQWRGKRLSA